MNQTATDSLKTTSKRTLEKETTRDLTSNKIANKITKVSRKPPQNDLQTIPNETENSKCDKKILKGKYIFPEKIHKIIDNLRLI